MLLKRKTMAWLVGVFVSMPIAMSSGSKADTTRITLSKFKSQSWISLASQLNLPDSLRRYDSKMPSGLEWYLTQLSPEEYHTAIFWLDAVSNMFLVCDMYSEAVSRFSSDKKLFTCAKLPPFISKPPYLDYDISISKFQAIPKGNSRVYCPLRSYMIDCLYRAKVSLYATVVAKDKTDRFKECQLDYSVRTIPTQVGWKLKWFYGRFISGAAWSDELAYDSNDAIIAQGVRNMKMYYEETYKEGEDLYKAYRCVSEGECNKHGCVFKDLIKMAEVNKRMRNALFSNLDGSGGEKFRAEMLQIVQQYLSHSSKSDNRRKILGRWQDGKLPRFPICKCFRDAITGYNCGFVIDDTPASAGTCCGLRFYKSEAEDCCSCSDKKLLDLNKSNPQASSSVVDVVIVRRPAESGGDSNDDEASSVQVKRGSYKLQGENVYVSVPGSIMQSRLRPDDDSTSDEAPTVSRARSVRPRMTVKQAFLRLLSEFTGIAFITASFRFLHPVIAVFLLVCYSIHAVVGGLSRGR